MSYWALKAWIYNYEYIDFIDCCKKVYEYFQIDVRRFFNIFLDHQNLLLIPLQIDYREFR